ncbi:hypothetical protein DXV75_14010 [Alteromonas aestuariivivens]|uniref:Copper-binding protein MbnP-like domain-containing protein n=1 Tax=Alteromonas aestuariivivens TaxID=1938339 RepID=A0A3D8M3X0_9ALTE|nr:MbnP family protein [Alteromonas aestuariivivens]RDV24331.1 hypothetical protein DXV75_14010 [Alteromonas aestuariivivens]
MRNFIILGFLITALLMSGGCERIFEEKPAAGEIPIVFTDLQPSPSGDCRYKVKVANDLWTLDFFSFFLTEPRIKIEGKWLPLKFIPSSWQTEDVARLEFHHACALQSNNTRVQLDANADLLARATVLRFTLGLPDNINRQAEWPAPFQTDDMFISDLFGHNFMRLALSNIADAETHHWEFGLASSLCEYTEGEEQKVVCKRPNRLTVDLPMAQNVIDLKLLGSLSQLLFRANLKEQPDCVLAHNSAQNCTKVLNNLLSRDWIRWDAPDKVYLSN